MASIINATTSTGLVSSADNSGSLQLATNNGTTAVTIDTSQNVGVGTTSPSAKFHVSSSSNTPAIVQASNAESYLKLTSTGGSSYIGTKTNSIEFLVNNAGNYAASFNSSGNLLVGTTSLGGLSSAYTSTGYLYSTIDVSANTNLQVWNQATSGNNRFVEFYTEGGGGSLRGSITYNRGAGQVAYNTTSDYRLKENIVNLPNALATVSQLKPRQFDWKETGNTTTGFIAHELAEVLPHAVTGDKDAVQLVDVKNEEGNVVGQEEKPVYQGIDTSFLVATLTAAIQELNAKVEAQAARIAELEGAK